MSSYDPPREPLPTTVVPACSGDIGVSWLEMLLALVGGLLVLWLVLLVLLWVLARRVVEARETSFRQLADHVPGTLWVTNPAGECTYLSARWYATTGQTQAE